MSKRLWLTDHPMLYILFCSICFHLLILYIILYNYIVTVLEDSPNRAENWYFSIIPFPFNPQLLASRESLAIYFSPPP